MEAAPPQPTGPEESAANVLVQDTTGREVLCPCPDGSELFWQHEWDLHSLRQVLQMAGYAWSAAVFMWVELEQMELAQVSSYDLIKPILQKQCKVVMSSQNLFGKTECTKFLTLTPEIVLSLLISQHRIH